MDSHDRYQNEIEFSERVADKRLQTLLADLRLTSVEPFEKLCEGIHHFRTIPDFFGDLSDKKVLDLACGDGWLSLRFASSGAYVWACDISPKMIELARRYAESAQLDIEFETMIVEEMTYEDEFFDCVLMNMALHHCDIGATAQQIKRVLKPGGKAVLVEDYAYHPLMRVYRAFTADKHTKYEHALTNEDITTFVSCFSSHTLEYSGLLAIFEVSGNRLSRLVNPFLRWLDNIAFSYLRFLKRYARLVTVKVVK